MFSGIMLFLRRDPGDYLLRAEGRRAPGLSAETLTAPALSGWAVHLDRIWSWVAVAVLLIVIGYGPYFATYAPNFVSPRYRFF